MNDIQKKRLVTETLLHVGADISHNGFYMLRDTVLACMQYELPAKVRNQELFTPIGEKYGMSYQNVYRDIRWLIGNIMLHQDVDFLESYFGKCYRSDRGSVTPKAFIIRITDDVSMQYEELRQKGGTV